MAWVVTGIQLGLTLLAVIAAVYAAWCARACLRRQRGTRLRGAVATAAARRTIRADTRAILAGMSFLHDSLELVLKAVKSGR